MGRGDEQDDDRAQGLFTAGDGAAVDLRLTRRGLFTTAGAVAGSALAAAALSACDSVPAVSATPTPVADPPADVPLATWELTGGFLAAGMLALRPPRLVVYGDGDAIADAAYRSRLDTEQVQSLASALVNDLRSTDAQKKPTGTPSIVDAPVTKVSVWSPAGVLTRTAEGLDELRPEHAYADVLYDARDRLAAVHKTVSATAQPYLATRVRVVAVIAEGDSAAPTGAAAWPSDVQLPAQDAEGLRRADLDGDPARGAVRMLTRDLDQRGAWPVYRLQDGSFVCASWRYLLPNE